MAELRTEAVFHHKWKAAFYSQGVPDTGTFSEVENVIRCLIRSPLKGA